MTANVLSNVQSLFVKSFIECVLFFWSLYYEKKIIVNFESNKMKYVRRTLSARQFLICHPKPLIETSECVVSQADKQLYLRICSSNKIKMLWVMVMRWWYIGDADPNTQTTNIPGTTYSPIVLAPPLDAVIDSSILLICWRFFWTQTLAKKSIGIDLSSACAHSCAVKPFNIWVFFFFE